ncbi:MAG: lactate utilization protein, partial [Phycisphaerales bacterium]|nr:lactate utilization protein [Phycisphaerales bacterium]
MTQTARQFQRNCDTATDDKDHREWVRIALNQAGDARSIAQAKFRDWDGACDAASQIKWESLDHLAENLESFEAKLKARGACVHWAETGEDACAYILRVAAERQAKRIVKSKCMTTEEIGLNERLEAAGLNVVESDLGEFIVQLRKEPPYHFVFPAMHLRRDRISETFEREIGAAPTE